MSLGADGNAVRVDCKIFFINRRTATFVVQVNKGRDPMFHTVLIIRHGIVGRIDDDLLYNNIRKELFHGIPCVKETVRIMPGGRAKEREDRKVIFGIGGSEHIEIIAKVIAVPMGIPADVTVRLAIDAAAFAVVDPFLEAITSTFLPLLCGGIDGSAITGQGKVTKINESFLHGTVEEKRTEDLKDTFAGFHILRRVLFKFPEKVFDSNFADRWSFFPFLFRLQGFFLWRMDRIREIVFPGDPKPGEEISKGSNAGSIANGETGDDGMQMVLLEVSSPFRIRDDLKLYRHKDRAEHIRRESGFRTKNRIAVLHEGIHFRKIKVPEFFHNVTGMGRERGSSIRIIFTQLRQDTVLIGGMATNIYRFQKKRTPNSKNEFRLCRTNYLVNQGARSAAFLERFVNSYFEKSGGIYKKGFLEAAQNGA